MRLQSKLFAIIFAVTASLLMSFSLIVYAIVSQNVNQLVSQQSEILAEQVLHLAEFSYQANQEAVRHYLKVADHFVQNRATLATNQEISLVAKNQETGSTQAAQLAPLLIDGQNVAADHNFVDLITQLTGATTTIFQMIPQGLLRVSTSVRDEAGARAVGTYIPASSPVYQAVQRGEVYEGRAFVVDNWYITEYEPIRNQAGSIIGALYVGIQQSKLNLLRDKIADITVGKSGFAYIIDGDGNILVHPDFVGETIADHPQLQPILETPKGMLTLAAEDGRDRIDYVDYLDVMDWHVGIATYPDETFALPRRIALLLGVMTAIGVIAAGLVGRLVGNYVAQPIAKVAKAMQHVAAGDLAVKSAGIRSRDEVGTLSRSVDQMVERLSAVVGSIKTSATQLSKGSNELTHTSERVADGATQQAVSVNEIAASMAQIRSTIQHSAETAQETQLVAEASAAQAQAGGAAVLETVEAMNRIVKEIQGVEEIARNTNLLALNAAVEAANAGDTSEEFAVVAREVRRLAQQSGQTAAEISQVSQSSIATAKRTAQLLQELVPQIQQTATYVQQIALAAAEQQSGAEQITQAVDQLNGVVQQNAAAAQDLEAMATALATQAQSLSATVAFFTVSEQQPSHPTTLAASFR